MEFKDEGSGTTTGQWGDSCLFYISSPFHPLVCPLPSVGPRYVALIPLLLYASLPLPHPSKTNLIPSRAGRETESWARWGEVRHKAEKWAGTSSGGSSPEAIRRGMGTFSSSIPGSHRLGFCHFTTSHTHTLHYGTSFPQSKNFCLIMLKGHRGHVKIKL